MALVTLNQIIEAQSKISVLIASYEKQTAFPVTVDLPTLNDGEIYIGTIITAEIRKHIILLPEVGKKANWKDQVAWAKSIGGELPDRVESALLHQVANDQFEKAGYWTREEHPAYSDFAFFQGFESGYQYYYGYKDYELLARAVRSVVF